MNDELKKASAGFKFYQSIILLSVFGLVVLVWRCFIPTAKELDQKRAEARMTKLEALQKDNEQKLNTYAWANKDKGIVQIPIDAAMNLVANELATKPITVSAVKVENPYPYGLQTLSFAPVPAATGTAATSGTQQPAPGAAPAASGTASPAPAGNSTPAPSSAATGTTAPAPAASGSEAPMAPGVTPTPGQ